MYPQLRQNMICVRLLITIYFSGNSALVFEVGFTLAGVFHFLDEVVDKTNIFRCMFPE